MDVNSDEFKNKLDNLCRDNWKARAIMKANSHDFMNLPEHQRGMFLKAMGLDSVTQTIK